MSVRRTAGEAIRSTLEFSSKLSTRRVVLLLAFGMRAVLARWPDGVQRQLVYDEIGYDLLAKGLVSGDGLTGFGTGPTASRVPGFPLFLGAVYSVVGGSDVALLLQVLIGTLNCVLISAWASMLFGRLAGGAALIISSSYPLLLYMNRLLYAETVALSFMLIGLISGLQIIRSARLRWGVPAGVSLGAAALTSPLMALTIPVLAVAVLLACGRRAARPLTGLVVAVGIMVAPWMLRNYGIFHTIVPLSSLAGSNLWSGNNAAADGGFVLPTVDTWVDGQAPDWGYLGWSELGEAKSSARFAVAALVWIRSNPGDWLELLPKKVVRLWSPVAYGRQFSRSPNPGTVFVVVPPYIVFLILAVVGATAARGAKMAVVWTPIVATTVAAGIYYGATRYGIAMSPSLIVLASYGLARLGRSRV